VELAASLSPAPLRPSCRRLAVPAVTSLQHLEILTLNHVIDGAATSVGSYTAGPQLE